MKKIFLTLSIQFALTIAFAQPDPSLPFAQTITVADLKDRLSIIASDALEGRMTGSRGQKMAAAFISDHFKRIGLQPPVNGSYFQPFELYASTPGRVYIQATTTFNNYKEIIYLGNTDSEGEKKLDVIFAGYGREQDYQKINVKGKAVLIIHDALSEFRMQDLPTISKRAHQKGAAMVLYTANFKTEKFYELGISLSSYWSEEDWSLDEPQRSPIDSGSFLVLGSVAEKIFNTSYSALTTAAKSKTPGTLAKIKNGNMVYQVEMKTSSLQTENVLGFLEGTDKKDEVLVITAHYDHVGKESEGDGDLIYNGADDDGSGTVAVLELAEAFAEAKRKGQGPRRSILFMTVTGEELGLFGSEYYVTHPVYTLQKTVANLNIDMIGRKDGNYELKSDYIYVIGSDKLSKELHEINEKANQQHTHLLFDYVYNNESHPDRLYYRSDHWNFARNNIPIIFYFDGIHSDYHQVTDEADRINYELLSKRTKLVFHTAWEIANRENRLKLD